VCPQILEHASRHGETVAALDIQVALKRELMLLFQNYVPEGNIAIVSHLSYMLLRAKYQRMLFKSRRVPTLL